MNQLINVIRQSNGKIAVNARDLYRFLNVKTPFRIWFPRTVKSYGFIYGTDFQAYKNVRLDNHHRGSNFKIYILTLDCAKEIAMVQRNERGRQARRYFIRIQKAYMDENPVRDLMNAPKSRILSIAAKAEQLHEHDLPKVNYYDKSMRNPGTMTTTVIAKDYGMSAHELNELLYKFGVIYKQGKSWVPYSKYQNMKLGSFDSFNYDGNHEVSKLWKWNQRGEKKIHDVLHRHGYRLNAEQLDLINQTINQHSQRV